MDSALLVFFSTLPRFPSPPSSSGPSMPSPKNSSMALQPVKEPGLAELPLIADAMVAAGLPHGAGLDDMARIEDTSSSVREAVVDVGRPQAALLDVVNL